MSMFYELMMRNKDRKMPSNYELVEYIESTGTQYIQTDIIANNETGMQLDVDVPQTTEDTIMIGSRPTNSGDNRFYIGKSLTWYLAWNTLGNRNRDSTGRLVCSINFYNNRKTYLKNADLDVITSELSPQTSAIAIFGANIAGTVQYLTKIKLYSAQITQGNKLVRNFIPVYDILTQKYGMWESVQGKFYGNDGTGDFKGSIVGYTKVGSPTITDGVVSGFSTSDYLQINNFTQDAYDKYLTNSEIVVKVKTTSTTDEQILSIPAGGAYSGFITRNTNSILWQLNGTTYRVSKSNVFQANVDFYIKGTIQNNIATLSYSTDGINFEILNSLDISEMPKPTLNYNFLRLGIIYSNTNPFVNGSIDLKGTYIKLDNKLWFNGQPS